MKGMKYILLVIILLTSCSRANMSTPAKSPTGTGINTPSQTPSPSLTINNATSTSISVTETPMPTEQTVVPTLDPTQEIQQEEIKGIIEQYFVVYYQVLSTKPPADFEKKGFGDLISDMPEARDFEEIEVAKLQVQAKYWELNKFRFTDYNHTLEYDSFTFNQEKNQVTVYLLDKAEAVQEISLVRNPKDPRVTYLGFGHIFILHKEGEEWKIVSDTYFDSWWQQFRKPGATKEEILNAIDAKRQKLNQTP